jgi:hypothetical protein
MTHEMSLARTLGAGLGGAVVLTLVNEIGHRVASESPRLDVLGMRAVVRGLRTAGREPPQGRVVPLLALAGDLAGNALVYGAAVRAKPERGPGRGLLAGLVAGTIATLVGPRLGMNNRTGYHWGRRLAMVAFYALGGLAAGELAARLDAR